MSESLKPLTLSFCIQPRHRVKGRLRMTAAAGVGPPPQPPTGLWLLAWLGVATMAHVLVALFGVLNRFLQARSAEAGTRHSFMLAA